MADVPSAVPASPEPQGAPIGRGGGDGFILAAQAAYPVGVSAGVGNVAFAGAVTGAFKGVEGTSFLTPARDILFVGDSNVTPVGDAGAASKLTLVGSVPNASTVPEGGVLIQTDGHVRQEDLARVQAQGAGNYNVYYAEGADAKAVQSGLNELGSALHGKDPTAPAPTIETTEASKPMVSEEFLTGFNERFKAVPKEPEPPPPPPVEPPPNPGVNPGVNPGDNPSPGSTPPDTPTPPEVIGQNVLNDHEKKTEFNPLRSGWVFIPNRLKAGIRDKLARGEKLTDAEEKEYFDEMSKPENQKELADNMESLAKLTESYSKEDAKLIRDFSATVQTNLKDSTKCKEFCHNMSDYMSLASQGKVNSSQQTALFTDSDPAVGLATQRAFRKALMLQELSKVDHSGPNGGPELSLKNITPAQWDAVQAALQSKPRIDGATPGKVDPPKPGPTDLDEWLRRPKK